MENLKAAAAGENLEYTVLYPEAAHIAEEEGFKEIAEVYKAIAKVEQQHEKRYLSLLKNVENGTVFKKGTTAKWRCRNCGYVYEGSEAPLECPACVHPRDYYELLAENY